MARTAVLGTVFLWSRPASGRVHDLDSHQQRSRRWLFKYQKSDLIIAGYSFM